MSTMDCRIEYAPYQAMLHEEDLQRAREESGILRLLPISMNFFSRCLAQGNLQRATYHPAQHGAF